MRRVLISAAVALFAVSGWSADWLTDGHDPQRTGWQKDEMILSVANVKDLKLPWTLQTDAKPRQMRNLVPWLILEKLNSSEDAEEIAILAGVSDNPNATDIASGKPIWSKHLNSCRDPAGARLYSLPSRAFKEMADLEEDFGLGLQ
jgi:hypothetical protein